MSELPPLSVMITRPVPQGEMLCNKIREAGAFPFFFPTIEIIPLIDSFEFTQAITQLHKLDWLIFISPQAVQLTAAIIHMYWPSFPEHVKIAALGAGTATALQKAHLPIHIYPSQQWNSEGFLAMPDFQQINGQKIALIRGEGGRTFLADQLTHRGAEVLHLIAYRRCLSKIDINPFLNLFNRKKIDIIISTSCEILQNLIYLVGKQAGPDLYNIPLVVISERMVELAKKLDFQTILLATNASDEAIMAILKDHVCQMKLKKN